MGCSGIVVAAALTEYLVGPKIVELVSVSLIDGDLGDLLVMDVELKRRNDIQLLLVPGSGFALKRTHRSGLLKTSKTSIMSNVPPLPDFKPPSKPSTASGLS